MFSSLYQNIVKWTSAESFHNKNIFCFLHQSSIFVLKILFVFLLSADMEQGAQVK